MTLLDIAGSGVFSHAGWAEFIHVVVTIIVLVLGAVAILMLTLFSGMGATIYSVFKGVESQSVLKGGSTLIHATGYVAGGFVALVFALVAAMFFSISAIKLLFVSAIIGFVVAFIVRETLLFMVLKKFGKYVMFLTALQWLKNIAFSNAEQETQP